MIVKFGSFWGIKYDDKGGMADPPETCLKFSRGRIEEIIKRKPRRKYLETVKSSLL